MKKYYLLLALLLACGTASAQKTHYQGEVVINYGLGVGDIRLSREGVFLINGFRFNPYFSAGVGIGLDYLYAGKEESYLSLPLFADLKFYVPLSPKVDLLAWFDGGYSFGLKGEKFSGIDIDIQGLMISPGLGVNVKSTERIALNIGLCYINQKCTLSYQNETASAPVNAIGMKMGMTF